MCYQFALHPNDIVDVDLVKDPNLSHTKWCDSLCDKRMVKMKCIYKKGAWLIM